MSRSNDEEYIQNIESKDFFTGNSLIDVAMLTNNLKFGQSVHWDTLKSDWVVESSLEDLIDELKDKATENRFEDMEFALDEKGRPDGVKNKQEMVLTIASDIANSISELVFEEAKQVLEKDDWVDTKAMEMLKESMED